MHSLAGRVTIHVLVSALAIGATANAEPVTFERLLEEMAAPEVLAKEPDPFYKCAQFSSYDRKSTDPEVKTEENWFANRDADHFVRVEERDGAEEYVLMDVEGPGAVVRIWSANPWDAGDIRFYLDGAEEPAFEASLEALVTGKHPLVPEPIAGRRAMGGNCYLPIPYAKSCKITSTKRGYYYHVTYRTYEAGTEVKTFSPTLDADAEQALAEAVEKLKQPAEQAATPANAEEAPYEITLDEGESFSGSLSGPRAIYAFTCNAEADNVAEALRGTLLEITFDGADTPQISAPFGDFFGTAPGVNGFESLPLGVQDDGTMYAHWVMPFKEWAAFKLTNHSGQQVSFQGKLLHAPYKWTDDSRYLRVNWLTVRDEPTRPIQDWTLLDAEGAGHFVGCTYHVTNPVINWWGEGDEKVYVDGEAFPSTFGTGTEDYFGYAWCWNELFTSPYINQIRADGPGNFGHSTVSRYHFLDAIPFKDSLRFDMEIWHHVETKVSISAAVFWYAAPGTTAEYDKIDAAMLTIPELPTPDSVEGAIEGEKMAVEEVSNGTAEPRFHPNKVMAAVENPGTVLMSCLMTGWHGHQWSGYRSLWWHGAAPGETAIFTFESQEAGTFPITLRALKGPLFGQYNISINGAPADAPVVLYQPEQIGPETDFPLGTFELKQGENTLTVVSLPYADPNAQQVNVFNLDYLLPGAG